MNNITDNDVKLKEEFIAYLKNKIPSIVYVEEHESMKGNRIQKYFMIHSTQHGLEFFLFNLTFSDFKLLFNNGFVEYTKNILPYFSLLSFYNTLLYNIKRNVFNLAIIILNEKNRENEDIENDQCLKISGLAQDAETCLLSFSHDSSFQRINFENKEEGHGFMYSIELSNDSYYEALREAFNRELKRYVNIDDITLDNYQSISNIVEMIKFK